MTNALVTGAGKRLGRAMALELARLGYNVALHYATARDEAQCTAQEIRALGRNAVVLQADLLDEAQVAALVPSAIEGLGGPITCLVNNASVFEYDSLQSATRTSWDRHFESNLRAPFVLTQAIARSAPEPLIDDSGEPVAQAVVINMIDQRVRKLTPEFMTYTLAKSALWTLTQTSSQALAPRVRVNAIGPGPTLQGHRQSDSHFQRQRRNTVLGRGANEKDITEALQFLVNAQSVTGQLICVDGGQHLGWQTPDVLGVEL